MKKTKITLLISSLLFGLFFVFTSTANAEVVQNFSSTINVMPDSSIIVEEKISYDFEDDLRHGIYRTIPLINSKNEPIKIEVLSVDLDDNASKFSTDITNNKLTIKIGDPSKLISDKKEYTIVYRVLGSISYYENFDEIYWNVTGNDWQFPILKSEARVVLPSNVFPLQQSCYYGKIGDKTLCKINELNIFSSENILNENEGLTIAVGFQKGVVVPYSSPVKEIDKYEMLKTFWPLFIPSIIFVYMFLRWFKKGRDPKGTGVIISQYDVPENLTPLEVGGIINNKIKNQNISAEIIYLATKGYIKIKQIEDSCDNLLCLVPGKDYQFTLLKEDGLLPNVFDRKIIKAIFGDNAEIGGTALLSSLNNSFYKSIKDINGSVIKSLLDKKYYLNFPKLKFNISFVFIGLWIIFMFNGFVGILGDFGSGSILFKFILSISIILSVIIFLIFNHLMPAKSKEGVILKEHLLGLKEYLQIAEKDRLNFHNAPDKKPEIFEHLLPYAMVFGVEELWAKEFKDIYNNSPKWYENKSSSFNVVSFGHEINMFNALAVRSFTSTPGSSSGGFSSGSSGGGSSGGGGGGGGGGSW